MTKAMRMKSFHTAVEKGAILNALATSGTWHEAYLKGWAFEIMVGADRVEIGPMRLSGYCMGAYTALCGRWGTMPELDPKELGRAYKKSRKAA